VPIERIEIAPDDERLLRLPPSACADRYAATFSAKHIKDLRRLGVESEQRKRLEPALRLIRLYSEKGPKLSEVRQHLDEVAETMRAASRALQALLMAPETEGARAEAKRRLRQASLRLDPNGVVEEPVDRMAAMLRDLLSVVEEAINRTPTEQTRPQAHTYPIAYIDHALQIGFNAVWKTVPIAQRKPNPFTPSAREGSPFRDVAAICYAAAGVPTTDPLRAIRAYLSELKNSSPKN